MNIRVIQRAFVHVLVFFGCSYTLFLFIFWQITSERGGGGGEARQEEEEFRVTYFIG